MHTNSDLRFPPAYGTVDQPHCLGVSAEGVMSSKEVDNNPGLYPVNTFTAIVDVSRFNNLCLKSPASNLVDLIFQSRSFSLNQLTWRETCTAASMYLADVIFIPSIVYYAYIAV